MTSSQVLETIKLEIQPGVPQGLEDMGITITFIKAMSHLIDGLSFLLICL